MGAPVVGFTPFHAVSANSNNATNVLPSAGMISDIVCGNVNASMRFVKFYDKATAPNPATDTPVYVLPVPGSAVGGSAVPVPFPIRFVNGISFAMVQNIADNDNTAVGAADLTLSFGYMPGL